MIVGTVATTYRNLLMHSPRKQRRTRKTGLLMKLLHGSTSSDLSPGPSSASLQRTSMVKLCWNWVTRILQL